MSHHHKDKEPAVAHILDNIEKVDDIQKVLETVKPEEVAESFQGVSEEDTEELGEKQKNLIIQIIGQLKIGMDLTKVLIPVDFLEPRSLLEKLTDFLTHCDIVCNAGDPEDPVQRMVELTRWYLSGWYVKPKGVKKPYNPALGEIFRANFELPDGSVLTFFAEQVCHHPPISAIYGENKQKDMAFEGWYYPRSKFLGNSAASVAEGMCKIHFRKRKELYVLTWPNVYARGIIFGKMLMEYGGKTSIACKQTKMTAEIEFKQKPFFGGEYNLVAAKIKKAGKTVYTIHGKWNQQYYIRDRNAKADTLFFNTKTTPKIAKHTPAFEQLYPNESRKRWYHLTMAIRAKDIEKAALEKSKVEEEQRAKVKEREQKGITYKPAFFKKGPEDFWIFIGQDTPEYQSTFSKWAVDGPSQQGPLPEQQ
jgi:hypothetical protein